MMTPKRPVTKSLGTLLGWSLLASALAWSGDPGVDDPVSTRPADQVHSQVISEGNGNTAVLFTDFSDGPDPGEGALVGGGGDIHVQRLDASGHRLGTEIPVAVAPGSQVFPRGVSDGQGNLIVVWADNRGVTDPAVAARLHLQYDQIRAQKIDRFGTPLWGAGGLVLQTQAYSHYFGLPEVLAGASGEVFIAYQKPESSHNGFATLRLSPDGTLRWFQRSGILVSDPLIQGTRPALVPGGDGGVIAVAGGQAQKFDALGQPRWIDMAFGARFVSNPRDNFYDGGVACIPDDAGGVIGTWGTGYYVYAQRIDATGQRRWGSLDSFGVRRPIFFYRNYNRIQGDRPASPPQVAVDALGGALFVYEDSFLNGDPSRTLIIIRRVNRNGVDALGPRNVSPDPNNHRLSQQAARILKTENPTTLEAIVSWIEVRDGVRNLRAQKLSASGRQWTALGTLVTTPLDGGFDLVGDGVGGAVWTFSKTRGGTGLDVLAKHVSARGALE